MKSSTSTGRPSTRTTLSSGSSASLDLVTAFSAEPASERTQPLFSLWGDRRAPEQAAGVLTNAGTVVDRGDF
ncbi:hypothetical protein [Microbulbifer rhizosphaerae]|uniref:Uncharacterized protein n=1 Tax=Microbulbifer rhizosphaerae TaxID=1562603 RepID=A0A7W4WBU8_9GAMM|nr:hypothetical protein [Microbulbifer rhizosphaerae]MBB3061399.1 hypothetical protein [Microbulbifer rhizosphaerae]